MAGWLQQPCRCADRGGRRCERPAGWVVWLGGHRNVPCRRQVAHIPRGAPPSALRASADTVGRTMRGSKASCDAPWWRYSEYTEGSPGIMRAGAAAHGPTRLMVLRLGRREDRQVSRDEQFRADALAHLDSLYGTALRLAGDRETAQDLVQETYLRAFQAVSRFEPGTNLKAWLFTILHNAHRNLRRSAARNPVETASDVVEHAEATRMADNDPEHRLLRETLDADLQEALDRLPDVFRQAVWLRDVEELTYAEIAGVMAVPVGTVMSRIARGRRLLYETLMRQREARQGVNGDRVRG
ncbi:MAG: sigma-70 family RNA polymerase sigma factor [Luteitalea sp.]|nr:sigma-70 family RNA polymerase sigma factor [Luteitalea sp.]